MDIFLNCGSIYISRQSTPKFNYLEELVTLCKGKVAATTGRANIIVGEFIPNENVVCVEEKWILDSITYNKRKNFKKYILTRPDSPSV